MTLSGRLPPFDSRYWFQVLAHLFSFAGAPVLRLKQRRAIFLLLPKKKNSHKKHMLFLLSCLLFPESVLSFCGPGCFFVFLFPQQDAPPSAPLRSVHQSDAQSQSLMRPPGSITLNPPLGCKLTQQSQFLTSCPFIYRRLLLPFDGAGSSGRGSPTSPTPGDLMANSK